MVDLHLFFQILFLNILRVVPGLPMLPCQSVRIVGTVRSLCRVLMVPECCSIKVLVAKCCSICLFYTHNQIVENHVKRTYSY